MEKKSSYALVTGSSRGIGRAVAERLASDNFVVAVHGSRHSDSLAKSFAKVKSLSPNSMCLAGDLADPKSIDNMFEEIRNKFGRLDVLVNNAGIQFSMPLLDMKVEDWDRVMAINLRAYFLCGQHAAKMMKESTGGKIINISSVHDSAPRRYYAHYSTSKAGIKMLTKCMALEFADYNIQANCITAGAIATEMTDPERTEQILPTIPAGRIAESSEVAELVRYLISPQASFITGSSIVMDGGVLLGLYAARKDLL